MSIVGAFQEMKRIYGFCPCCGEVFRLSDVSIYTKQKPPKTPFDRIDEERAKLDRADERFSERETEVRAQSQAQGQSQAKRRLRKIAPFFVAKRLDPQDVKVLFDPVDYVVFRGLNSTGVKDIQFIDHPPPSKQRERLQKSLHKALKAGNVEWLTLRISDDGLVGEGQSASS